MGRMPEMNMIFIKINTIRPRDWKLDGRMSVGASRAAALEMQRERAIAGLRKSLGSLPHLVGHPTMLRDIPEKARGADSLE